ncbi:MAG: NADH-quinone oxidoreductase subunit A [candidate division Zixibacteria bacterium]|nr:NADH-quinone oxidoreductase subunit A [candidate division Zixibacteria bacterium]NIR63679.1 NADH-quinone oxidoreductase subunit A [candidate division Zixibacteria bacterium]NIS18330.1 NADH-quinone oxidoreductase subunit A [candidate division Zixibacteria bacterium]NIS45632.1 NADH-quinone oxidoreductase subunit A [candidate division Zixibacteria bacterium]NIT54657.1 NADH-quinone oxidoreductase subunit A [candidate division Zixibacteria bacterium]
MLDKYLTVAVFLFGTVGFVLVTLFVAKLLRPARPSEIKLQNYECGEPTVGTSWVQFNVRFYIFALLFVIFDVETVFIFPWAVVYDSLGWFGFIEMTIFLAILIYGLVYAWKKGVLKWV